MRTVVAICIALFGLAAAPSLVYASDDEPSVAEQVEALSHEGAEHFNDGEFEAAIEKFEEAYELEPVPNLLYNIGHCYEQLEDWEQAQHYYEEFIRSPDADSDARDHAMDRVETLRELQRAEEEADDPEDDEAVAEAERELEQAQFERQRQPDDAPSLAPGFAVTGAGIAMIGAGALTGVFASGNADQIDDDGLTYDERLDAQSRARTQGVVADVFFIGGAVATATGGYLLFSALSADPGDTAGAGDTHSAIVPWFSRDDAGVGVHLNF